MKEPDSGSVSDNDEFQPVDSVSQLTRTVSSVNPTRWNEADIIESDLMDESTFEYGMGMRSQIKRDPESFSGDSRSSSSTSAGSGIITEDDLIDWNVYQKLLGQSERQCNSTSRWSTLILPNNMLITSMDKLTEMIERGLDTSNENGLQQMQGMLQQVIFPILRNIYNDDPGMTMEQFEKVMSCAFRFVTLFITKLKNISEQDEVLAEFWLILSILFNVHARFYQRISTNSLNSIMQVVPGDLDLSKLHCYCRELDSHHWFQAVVLWFAQSHGFETVERFFESFITPQTPISILSLYFSWLTGMLPVLQPSVVRQFIKPYVLEAYHRLCACSEKDFECEKIKGDIRESPYLTLFSFCKCSIYQYHDVFDQDMIKNLDVFKLGFLKGIIAESSFNTRMSALEELYRFLKCSTNDILGCHLDIGHLEIKIEEFGLVEAMYKDNLHHVAYIDRVEKVMADLFDRQLLMDSVLNIIWNSQKGKHEVIQRNVQILTARLAGHFSASIADGFFSMLQVSWITGDSKDRINIVELLRRVGFDQSNHDMISRVTNFLWKQSRTEDSIENQEFQAKMHDVLFDVLEEAFVDMFGKTTLLPEYILKCAEDICNDETPDGLIASSVALCKKLILCYSESKPNKSSPTTLKIELLKRVEQHIHRLFGKSFCDAIASNITKSVNSLPNEICTSVSTVSSGSKSDDENAIHISRGLVVQFEFLKFYYSDLALCAERLRENISDPDWINTLWKSVIGSTYPGIQDIGFRLFTDLMCTSSDCLFKQVDNIRNFFENNVLTLDPKLLSVPGFHCFEAFLKKTNIALFNMIFREDHEEMERNCFLTKTNILGEDYIWQLIIYGNENVQSLASNLYVCLFSSPSVEQHRPEYARAVVSKCMKVLNEEWQKPANTQLDQIHRGMKVRRILQTITELVDTNEKDHRLPIRSRPVLRRSFMGKGFVIRIQFRGDDMQILYPKPPMPLHAASPRSFNVHDNMLLVDLIEKICQYICNQGGVISPYSLSIVSKLGSDFEPFRVSEWGQTLRELGFDVRATVFAKPEKHRLGCEGVDDSTFLLKSGRIECELQESLLFSVVLASQSENLVRLVEMGEDQEVSEQAFALLGSVPSLKQAPSIEQYGSLEATIGPFKEYLKQIENETLPARQVYSLMVLSEFVLPSNLSNSNSYSNQLLFFSAGGIRICKNILVKNIFIDENSQLRGLGYHFVLRILSFSLLFALQVASLKYDKKMYRLMAEQLPRQTDCYMKETINRIIHDKPNLLLVDKVLNDCRCTSDDLRELLEVAFFLMKEHAHVSIFQDTNLEELEICAHDYDDGDLLVITGAQVFAYYCVLNSDMCSNVLVSTEWNDYVNATMFDERRLVACWTVEIIALVVVHLGFDTEEHHVYLFMVEQLFSIIDVASSKFYWELLYKIIEHCDKRMRLPNVTTRLQQCITWLEEAQKISQEQQCSFPDEVSLTGRLRISCLLIEQLTPEEKSQIGGVESSSRLIELLINHFLLPSSRAYVQQLDIPRSQTALEIHTAASSSMFDLHAFNGIPRSNSACPIPHRCVAVCGGEESQKAAYNVLVALATSSEPNMRLIKQLFMEMFYRNRSLERLIWDYQPDFSLRVAGNYVGLKNGGATCYMNSILQQIFMLPSLRNCILNIEPVSNDPDTKKAEEITSSYPVRALEALQSVFAHLVGYELDSYTPSEFWSTFRMCKEMVHLNEQQDALEFYNSVVDFVDEGMSLLGSEKICEKTFGGLFADEKICKDCPHRYSREEPFTSISIDVQSHNNLLESLKEYVLGDVLENDNAYFCEKCQKKVRAVKRLTIQRLPPILVVQLKRFKFDWDKEVPVKFNDYVEFPFDLDMKPYTAEAAAKADAAGDNIEEVVMEDEPSDCMYALRGVVVHSGSATGGHYYSFIKSSDDGKWYKFDDTEVTHYECDIKDVRSKWFGGNIKYTDDGSDDMCSKKRGRCWWNAYLLFYEKVGINEQESPVPPASGRTSADCSSQQAAPIATPLTIDASLSSLSSRRSSTGSPVTRLHKHFSTMSLSSKMRQMPPRLEVMVRQQNTKIMHERNQYNPNFFSFIKNLTVRTVIANPEPCDVRLYQHVCELFSNFLVYTCLHASAELRTDYNERSPTLWNQLHDRLIMNKSCRLWFTANIMFNEEVTRVYLLEAKEADVRQIYARMLHKVLSLAVEFSDTTGDLKEYNNVHLQRVLNSHVKASLRDSDSVAKLMLESIYHLITNDKEKRGMEVYSILTLFAAESAPKSDLFCMMVTHGILHLLLRIYETPAMQCFTALPHGIQHYVRLLVALLRVIDFRVFLSARLPGKPALTSPCPYMLADPARSVPVVDIRCPHEIQELLFGVPNYNLLTHLLNVYATGDPRTQAFMRETFMFFCWNNEMICGRAFEVILRTLSDERHMEIVYDLLLTIFADIVYLEDELTKAGTWLPFLLFSIEIGPYHPRSSETGLINITTETNKLRQENLLRATVILLERYEKQIPDVVRPSTLLQFANDIYSTIISRYTFHDHGEHIKNFASSTVPSKHDLVARLGTICQFLRNMVVDSVSEEIDDGPLELSISNSVRASISTPQSGEKRPFPDDDSPTTRRDSKKFNDGSEIHASDYPKTAEVDDPDLLMATSRSATDELKQKPVAPPPAYEESSFSSSK